MGDAPGKFKAIEAEASSTAWKIVDIETGAIELEPKNNSKNYTKDSRQHILAPPTQKLVTTIMDATLLALLLVTEEVGQERQTSITLTYIQPTLIM